MWPVRRGVLSPAKALAARPPSVFHHVAKYAKQIVGVRKALGVDRLSILSMGRAAWMLRSHLLSQGD